MSSLLEYMVERELIRVRKERGDPWPWTKDPILQKYKFTNVRRKNDRTTKALLESHYSPNLATASSHSVLLNCGIARYFGTIEFALAVGWQRRYNFDHIVRTAKERMRRKERVFTGAYIVTNCGEVGPKEEVVARFIGNMWALRDDVTDAFHTHRSWEQAYQQMVKAHGWGGKGFYAKEALQDYMLCYPGVARDELTWTPVGPGARRGLNRIYGRPLKFHQKEEKFVAEVQTIQASVPVGWNPPLSAHDIQFCLCEYDKYERVRLNEGRPRSLYHVRTPDRL